MRVATCAQVRTASPSPTPTPIPNQSAYDALLTGSDGADPIAAATAATAPPHAASAPAESMLLSSDAPRSLTLTLTLTLGLVTP